MSPFRSPELPEGELKSPLHETLDTFRYYLRGVTVDGLYLVTGINELDEFTNSMTMSQPGVPPSGKIPLRNLSFFILISV